MLEIFSCSTICSQSYSLAAVYLYVAMRFSVLSMKAGMGKDASVLLRGKYVFNAGKSCCRTDEHIGL